MPERKEPVRTVTTGVTCLKAQLAWDRFGLKGVRKGLRGQGAPGTGGVGVRARYEVGMLGTAFRKYGYVLSATCSEPLLSPHPYPLPQGEGGNKSSPETGGEGQSEGSSDLVKSMRRYL